MGRLWAGSLLFVSAIRTRTHGMHHVKSGQNYIIMANHQSALDIPLLFVSLPLQIRMMAKKSLFRIPIFGWALQLGGYIKIDRTNREQAISSMSAAAERITREGVSVVIFPEGTRSSDATLLDFKKGGFMFALQTGLPILPVSINGTGVLAPKGAKVIHPGSIETCIHPPVNTKAYGIENRDQLITAVRQSIQSGIK